MHIVVSWDITEGPDRTQISDQMVLILKPYSWVRPLTTFYILQTDAIGREAIIAGLTSITRRYPNRIRFVVSPLMQGRYQGILNPDDWAAINSRTD